MQNYIKEAVKKSIAIAVSFLPWRIIVRFTTFILQLKNGYILYYRSPEKREIMELINKSESKISTLIPPLQAYTLIMCVQKTEKIGGDIAEVGVFRGGTARLICETKKSRPLHLFDTFCGIPEVEKIDTPSFYKGQFAASLEDIRAHFDNYRDVYFYKGIFPATARPIKDRKFSFVHLDADTYKSTRDSLEFFYPRMNRGGIILSHDYSMHAGVKKALDEFFNDKPEVIIEITDNQGLIVKL